MSNASSSTSASWLRHFLTSPRAGTLAAAEFVLLIIGNLSLRGVDSAVILFDLLVWGLIITHSVVAIRRRQWDAWFSVLVAVFIFVLGQLIAVAVVANLLHGGKLDSESGTFTAPASQFSASLLGAILTLAAVYGYTRLFRIMLPQLGIRRPRWSDPVWAFAMVIPYLIVLSLARVIIQKLVPSFNFDQQQQLGLDNITTNVQVLLTSLSFIVLAPLVEEVVMRGLIYTSLKKAVPVLVAATLTSALFAAGHLAEGGSSGLLYVAALNTFILSLFLIYLREKTNGLWANITLHALNNAVALASWYAMHSGRIH